MSEMFKKRQIPEGWKIYKLKELGEYINGRAFKPQEWGKTGKPIIRIENLNNPNADFNYFKGAVDSIYKVSGGDLLVSWSASLDAYLWTRGEALLNQHIFKVMENKDVVIKEFLYFALRMAMKEIREKVHGATMKHITKPEFENFKLSIPPLSEQKRIVAILNEQMAAIKKARQAAEAQLEAANSLFSSYVNTLFAFFDSQKWPKYNLRSICIRDGQYGISMKSNSDSEGIPILGMYQIHEGKIRWENIAYVYIDENLENKYLLKEGDLLFNRTNSAELVGKTAVYNLPTKAVFASYLVRFFINPQQGNPYFVSFYINSREGRKFIERNMARAIGQVNISASTMHKMQIPLPSLDLQNSIVKNLFEKQKAVDKIRSDIFELTNTLKVLPNSILSKTFAGDI